MELLNEDEEDLTEVKEAANFQTTAYDAISADLLDSPIILPPHLRWSNFFLLLIVFTDNLSSLDVPHTH